MTREIRLSQGQVALVDDWRYEELSRWKWQAHWNENTKSFYATRQQDGTTIYMHRQIMNTPKGMVCDHRDHNTLDNQEHNLRNVTRTQNNMNRRCQSNNQLGEKCIQPHKKGFRVVITANHRLVFRKTFPTLELAKSIRDRVIAEVQAEFAYKKEQR